MRPRPPPPSFAPSVPLRAPRRAAAPRLALAAPRPPARAARASLSPSSHNRQARFRYDLLAAYECGVELLGTEIKSVRAGKLNLRDGFARVTNGELWLHGVHIAPCAYAAAAFQHDPDRPRRLLLRKPDIRKLELKQKEAGLTIVPTRSYFSRNGFLKIEVALARGKKLHDRRADIKAREDAREIRRVVKHSVARY